MKSQSFGILSLLLMVLASFGMGCEPYHRGVGVSLEIHDSRWHYDHDYDDNWRAKHAWHDDRHDWDH